MSEPCKWCPQVDKLHEEKDASMFLMCVIKRPGLVPLILTSPTLCVDPNEPGAPDMPLLRLVNSIRLCGHDIANEAAREMNLAGPEKA